MRNARFSITISQFPVFPVLFQHKVKLRYLCCHGLVIQIFYCKGSCHLISVSVVDRIYQFREDIFFPHRVQHALIHIIGQLLCGCRRVQLEKVVRNSLISSVVMESTVPSLCTAFGV